MMWTEKTRTGMASSECASITEAAATNLPQSPLAGRADVDNEWPEATAKCHVGYLRSDKRGHTCPPPRRKPPSVTWLTLGPTGPYGQTAAF
ncbi:hypothetical protein Q1695_002271 [Nippostrongylus brasiliensis]|nr:hypothetical protein Q1695_002271 [Nippostrongylus brasiliensis]